MYAKSIEVAGLFGLPDTNSEEDARGWGEGCEVGSNEAERFVARAGCIPTPRDIDCVWDVDATGAGAGTVGAGAVLVFVLSGLSSSGRETGVANRAETLSNILDISVSLHCVVYSSHRAVCSDMACPDVRASDDGSWAKC